MSRTMRWASVAAVSMLLHAAPLQAVGTPQAICAAAKQKAAGKKGAEKLKCHSKGLIVNLPVDSTCLAKAEIKFSKAFAKTEAKGGCVVTGDTATVEAAVDNFVTQIVGLTPATSTTTTTTTTTTTLPPCQATTAGSCWFLGGTGTPESCDTVCANASRVYDSATASYAGSGGTLANCVAVATDLGVPVTFTSEPSFDGRGCAYDPFFQELQRDTFPTSSSVAAFVQRVCACQ